MVTCRIETSTTATEYDMTIDQALQWIREQYIQESREQRLEDFVVVITAKNDPTIANNNEEM